MFGNGVLFIQFLNFVNGTVLVECVPPITTEMDMEESYSIFVNLRSLEAVFVELGNKRTYLAGEAVQPGDAEFPE